VLRLCTHPSCPHPPPVRQASSACPPTPVRRPPTSSVGPVRAVPRSAATDWFTTQTTNGVRPTKHVVPYTGACWRAWSVVESSCHVLHKLCCWSDSARTQEFCKQTLRSRAIFNIALRGPHAGKCLEACLTLAASVPALAQCTWVRPRWLWPRLAQPRRIACARSSTRSAWKRSSGHARPSCVRHSELLLVPTSRSVLTCCIW